MKKDRSELIEHLAEAFANIKDDKTVVNKIKKEMKDHKVLPGRVQEIINNAKEELQDENIGTIYFLAAITHIATGKMSIDPTLYFQPREIKEIETNFEGYISENINLPYTFHDVIQGEEDDFLVFIKDSEIKDFYDSGLLQYNPETQREMRQSKINDEIIETPKVIEKSVKEMEELIEKNEISSTMITWNLRMGSGDEGIECSYDKFNKTLTIEKGTLIDVLDGFHRINAIVRALRKNPESAGKIFKLNITNFNKGKARNHFAQINTTNPVGKGQLKRYSEKTQGVTIVEYLRFNSELKNYITTSDHISHKSNFLVTQNALIDAIDDVYQVEDRATAIKIQRYLADFIKELFFSFPDEFMGNISEIRDNSLINANVMFYGYILLSKMLKDNNIPLEKVGEIVGTIDFSRENKKWLNLKVIEKSYGKYHVTPQAKKGVYKFFSEIKLDKYREGANIG